MSDDPTNTIGVDTQKWRAKLEEDARKEAQARAHEAGRVKRQERDEAKAAARAGNRPIEIVRGIKGVEAIHRGNTLTIGLQNGGAAAAAPAQNLVLTVFYNGALVDISVAGNVV